MRTNRAPRRVVITGVGQISPLGSDAQELALALAEGRSGVRRLTGPLEDLLPNVRYGAEALQFQGKIDNFGPLDKDKKKAIRKGLKVMCRECQMGVAAAQLALADAGELADADRGRLGVSFGSDYMMTVPEEFNEGVAACLDADGKFEFARWPGDGLTKMSPLWLLKYLPNMPGSHIAIYNDFRGPNNSLTLREASSHAAVAEAFQIIRRGDAELMLAGATGTRLHPMKMAHAVLQEELADPNAEPGEASRPFDAGRTGMVLGEGAGAMILEDVDSAKTRGATVLGEIVAGATSCVASPKMTARRGQAMTNVLQAVLTHSGMSPDEIGHVHAHALSTRSCDAEEAQAIDAVFGKRSDPIPVTAAKSCFGNLGAGGGCVETIASLMALQSGRLPTVLNYTTPDEACPVAAVTDGGVPAGDSFISLSVTPQGQAAALLVRRFEA